MLQQQKEFCPTILIQVCRQDQANDITLADENADPEKVALDWMIEAEHGPDSAALLVTNCEELVYKAAEIVERQLEQKYLIKDVSL